MGGIFALIFGTALVMLMDGFENPSFYAAAVPFTFAFYSMVSDMDWGGSFRLILKLILNVPRSIIEGFEISIFKMFETFEVFDIRENEETEKVLCTTLTPKAIVFLSEGDRIHVHVLRR